MNNVQLLLSIGIPSFLVLLSMLVNNRRIDDLTRRFETLDHRIDELTKSTETRFAGVDRRFDELLKAVHSDTLEILRNMTELHERVAVVESKQRG